MDNKKLNVLFLCVGNSCRSQMAEAIVNANMADHWRAYSAGVEPAGFVHPLAIKALAEIGIEHKGSPKHPDVFRDMKFDLVITLCDPAAESCPVWLRGGRVIHFPLEDPAKAVGSEEEKMVVFRRVRDRIVQEIAAVMQP
ncbi:MAG: arsenate reductase ArsC [Chloroflexi bacterium]|nr:arsenate reductase ArsC [Chloroflexota bacterium]